MYQALYRKYRPKSFSEVTGQEHVTETLRSQVMTGRLSHAYLFVGTRGTGKTTCAKILSRAVNCLSPEDGNPCNKCVSCTGIESGTILDVMELDAASNRKIEDIRDIRSEAVYTPASAKKRIYILDEVHMLTTEAVNALLKILEEPPEHIIFILATTELHKVPATIQSRCQKFSFKRLAAEEISARLKEITSNEAMTLTDDAAAMLAMLADGSMRDGISLLDQCAADGVIDLRHVQDRLGLSTQEEILNLISTVADCDILAALEILDKLYKDGKDMAALVNELSAVLRDLLVIRLAPDTGLISSGISKAELIAMSKRLNSERLFYCLEIAKNALFNMSRTGISKLALEVCIIRMIDERVSDDPAALALRISQLEAGGIGTASVSTPAPGVSTASNAAHTPNAASVSASVSAAAAAAASAAASLSAVSAAPPAAPSAAPAPADFPAPASARGTAQTGNILADILSNINDSSLSVWLSDSRKAKASYKDNVLIIKMTDEFGASMVRDTYMDQLSEAVYKVTGKKTVIQIETEKPDVDSGRQSKLDELSSFGNVKFE